MAWFSSSRVLGRAVRPGFSLIELLVVVAIIALLAGVITFNVTRSRKVNQDQIRRSDLATIQAGVEVYFASNRKYPDDFNALLASGFLTKLPTDPATKTNYSYLVGQTSSQNTAFRLGAKGAFGPNGCLHTGAGVWGGGNQWYTLDLTNFPNVNKQDECEVL